MRPRFSALWRDSDFLKLWGGQAVSVLGSQITFLALPLTAVLMLGASPLQMGILTAAQTSPSLLVGLFAGAWVDRLRRRPVLIATDLGRGFLLGTVPLLAVLDVLRMEHLYAVGFLAGVLGIFFDAAYKSFLPSLVGPEHLVEANSKLEVSRSAAEIGGPGLAGGLVQLASAPAAILVDALSFVWSALLLALVRKRERAPEPSERRRSMPGEIGEGLRFVFGEPLLRPVALGMGTLSFCNSVFEAAWLLYLTRGLGIGPGLLGVIFATGSVGFLAGALVAGRVTSRLGVGPAVVATPVVIGFADLLTPLAGLLPLAAVPLLIAGQFTFGIGRTVGAINTVSLRQAITPERLWGRMNASMDFTVYGLTPLGALAGGALAQGIGLQPTLALAAAGEMLAFFWLFSSPMRRLRSIPEWEPA